MLISDRTQLKVYIYTLEKEMESHSNILVWEIPWTDEPGGLYSPWGRKELDTTELNMKKLNMHLLG